VEFLETFVRQTDSVYVQRCKLLGVDLDVFMADQEHLYAFMQYMKTTCHIHLLQFYRDIKSFQTKILNPDLSDAEKESLHRQACDIYKLLQTSRALYQAARQSHAVLEKIMLPRFLHSEEFYKLLIGSRVPTGYQKNLAKKPHERLMQSALKLGNKLKGALKSTTIDGQVLDCFANIDEAEVDGVDNVDILKYLDSIAADELRGDDLSNYKVVLTNVETRLTSRALYQAARQSHAVLEKIMLPRFLHSEEFYKLLIGSRVPTGYQKNLAKKPHERLMQSALKLGNKLKGALKSTTIDGQVLDCFANIDEAEVDGVDNVDILKYLDSIAADELRGDDLSNYKVVLTNVETRLVSSFILFVLYCS
ncbi:hypothetical protein O3G_MSEX015104, partial [Manduca sexta]